VKVLTKAKLAFKEHAEREYGGAKILYGKDYDFVLPDGRRGVVKVVVGDLVRFGGGQWRALRDGDLVALVSRGSVLAVLPFSEVKKGRVLEVGGRRVFVVVEGRRVLRIPCSEEVYREFKRLAEELGGEEEALRRLVEAYRRGLPGVSF